MQGLGGKLMQEGQAEAGEYGLSRGAPFFADDQHFGAGRPFGIREHVVLLDDERPPQRDHHQNAQQAAQHADGHDPHHIHVEAQQQQRGNRHAHAEGDRFSR